MIELEALLELLDWRRASSGQRCRRRTPRWQWDSRRQCSETVHPQRALLAVTGAATLGERVGASLQVADDTATDQRAMGEAMLASVALIAG